MIRLIVFVLLAVTSLVPAAWANFPTLAAAPTTSSTDTAATSHTVSLPGSIASGDLVCASLSFGTVGAGTITWPDGTWVSTAADFSNATGTVTISIRCHIGTGSEGATISVTTVGTTKGAFIVWRVAAGDWHGTTMPECGTTGGGTVVTGNSTSPDPGSFNPANWDTEDTTYFAVAGYTSSGTTVTAFPLADNNTQKVGAGGSSQGHGFATSESATSSLDVSAWTISATVQWVANTCAIRPVGQSQAPRSMHQYRLRRQ